MNSEMQPGNVLLWIVLNKMNHSELISLLSQTFKRTDINDLSTAGLRRAVVGEFGTAGSLSLPWAKDPSYEAIVGLVAKNLKLPAPADSHVSEIERAILFKVLEKSLEKMTSEQKDEIARRVEAELKARGIDKRVAFNEVLDFVKFAGMDVVGTLGGLVMAGPGLTGMIGLNFLQWIVLKAVILTSGHMAAAGAILGVGAGGALMTAAGVAGPIGVAAAFLYTGYVLAGPAFRKLIPAICVVAAKRIELESEALPGVFDPVSAA